MIQILVWNVLNPHPNLLLVLMNAHILVNNVLMEECVETMTLILVWSAHHLHLVPMNVLIQDKDVVLAPILIRFVEIMTQIPASNGHLPIIVQVTDV